MGAIKKATAAARIAAVLVTTQTSPVMPPEKQFAGYQQTHTPQSSIVSKKED